MKKKNKNKNKIIYTAFGGMGEFGKNMMSLEYENQILIIDCGMMLGKNRLLGIDAEINDSSYFSNNKKNIKGVLITHGHLDHVGGLPYLLSEINVPIYAPPFACLLIGDILREHNIEANIREIRINEKIKLGHFAIESVEVDHSIIDSFAYCISTPVGMIVHSGDYRVDHKPFMKNKTNVKKFSQLGKKKVLALFSDSTNSNKVGKNVSESDVFANLKSIVKESRQSRIILTTFSTQVNRIQQILEIAKLHGRKVFFIGKSMVKNMKNASKDFLKGKYDDVLRPISDLKKFGDNRVIVVTTGSQGEVNSALTRIIDRKHRDIKLKVSDVVVFSSSTIPGNELEVVKLLDSLILNGNKVFTNKERDIHSSGHGFRDDLKDLIKRIQPKFFFPLHGNFYYMNHHIEIAKEVGLKMKDCFLVQNGMRIGISENEVSFIGKLKLKKVYLEQGMISTISENELEKRKRLMMQGVISVSLMMKGNSLSSFDIDCIGVVGEKYSKYISTRAKEEVALKFERGEIEIQEKKLRKFIKKLILNITRKLFLKEPEVIIHIQNM